MADPIPISVTALWLDEENPRLDTPNQGQRGTIKAMAAYQGSRLQVLAQDIVNHGLDPSELFIVMEIQSREHGEQRYLVLDGNRRATALKVLESPEIVHGVVSNAVLRALKQASSKYHSNPIDTVLCVIVNDRDEANHWIELKHTAYNDGAGPLRWGPDEGARFSGEISGKLNAETQALNFLQQRGDITQDFRRNVPTSTFRRLLHTPKVREKLGVDWKRGQLTITGDEDAAAKALKYVATDLVEHQVKVRDLDHAEDRVRYAESLPPEIVVERISPSTGPVAGPPTQQRTPTTTTRRRSRDRLIPHDARIEITDTRIRDIETELRLLNVEQYPNAVSVLFRVFLELSADSYIVTAGLVGFNDRSPLGAKLQAVTDDLVQNNQLDRQKAKVVRRACQRDSYLGPSITGMNQYIHNQHQFPSPGDLWADWDNLQPWFEVVWPAQTVGRRL